MFVRMILRALLMLLLSVGGTSGQVSTIQSVTQPCGTATIEYFSQGQGEPVVLLPGSGFGVDYLQLLAEALARGGYRAVRIKDQARLQLTGHHVYQSGIVALEYAIAA